MKILLISDTHNQHSKLDLPDADIIIHSGDMSGRGEKYEITDFLIWYSNLPYKHKILIAGNHDNVFENDEQWCLEQMPENIIYLNDNSTIIEGINIWGSPISPFFYDWAFNRLRGNDIKKHWDLIPDNTDILITHGPPYGFGDEVCQRHRKPGEDPKRGCVDLLEVIERIKPKLHVFGHIHEKAGDIETNGETVFVNASSIDENYYIKIKPYVLIDYDKIENYK